MDLQQDSFEVTTSDIEDSKIDESLVGCFPMFFSLALYLINKGDQ